MDPTLIGSATFGIAIFLMFWGLARVIQSQSVTLESRLGQEYGFGEDLGEGGRARGKGGRFNRLVSGSARSALAVELSRADLRLTPGEFVAGQIMTTFLGLALGYLIFRGNLFFAVFGGVVGLYSPRWYLGYLQRKRLAAFNSQLPDAILLLANSLRSGYSFLQSMDTVSKELGSPMSNEFSRVTREMGLGVEQEQALNNMLRRVPSEDLNMLITAIHIQNEVGGNLAEVLDNIAHTIRERVRIMGEIRTITAQQRLSANLLSLLPLILGLIIYALSPGYVSQLWENTCGLVLIAVGASMTFVGYFIIRRIAAIEV